MSRDSKFNFFTISIAISFGLIVYPACGSLMSISIESSLPPESSQINGSEAVNLTAKLLNELDTRSLDATIFITGDMARAYPLYIAFIGSKDNHELGVAGMTTNEDLGNMSSQDQYLRLVRAKEQVESNYICGVNSVDVLGYLPQPGSFEPGAIPIDTLKELNLRYVLDDSGYGDESATSPYTLGNDSVWAIPASTSIYEGINIFLSDIHAKSQGLNGTQWYSLLADKYNQSEASGDPMVVVFHSYLSGSEDYLDAYARFIEYAVSRDATFIKAQNLVDLSQ